MNKPGVRDAKGRMLGDPAAGPVPSGHVSVSLRVAAPRAAVRAFEALTPRQRGAVIDAWHKSGGSSS